MQETSEITKVLETELDSVVSEVMTDRRKYPELTDQQYMDKIIAEDFEKMEDMRMPRKVKYKVHIRSKA